MAKPPSRVLGAGHPRVAELRRLLRQRGAAADWVLIEGARTVGEALDQDMTPRTVIVEEASEAAPQTAPVLARIRAGSPASDEIEVLIVRRSVFAKLAPAVAPQPMLALFDRPRTCLPEAVGSKDVWLVLTGVADPGNTGTLIRAADAFAASGVVVAGGADPWAPKAVRASAGAVLRMPPATCDAQGALRSLSRAGARIVASDARRGEPHDGGVLGPPLAIVVGSETHGLDPAVEPLVDGWCRIVMAGRAESLNVAMAGTLLLHEACRRPGRRAHAAADRHDPPGTDRPRASESAEAHAQQATDRQVCGCGESRGG